MVSADPRQIASAFDGLAVFAGAAFALGLGLIAALERVGAPDGFVEALGPLLAFVGLCVVGIATRAPSLPDFLAARRSTPAFYGGLAFAATAAGLDDRKDLRSRATRLHFPGSRMAARAGRAPR